MKKFFLIFIISIVAVLDQAIVAQDASGVSNRMLFGYSTGNLFYELGMPVEMTIRGAIEIPSSELIRLQGNKITKIQLAIANTLSSQNNFVFISKGLDQDFSYQQEVSTLNAGWNTIELSTPWEITDSEPLFIGFQYRSVGEVLSMDGSPDNPLGNWIRISQNKDLANSSWQHQSGGVHNLFIEVEGSSLPQNDIRLLATNIKRYAVPQSPTPLRVKVRNRAAAPITSLQIKGLLNQEVLFDKEISGIHIDSGKEEWVAVGALNIESEGIYSITTTVSSVNGQEDETPQDNQSMVKNVIVRPGFYYRNPLLELFSTMKCRNCPLAHKMVELFASDRPELIHMVHHAGFGTDTLTIPESEQYLFFYQYNGNGDLYAPGVCIDRTNQSPNGAESGSESSAQGTPAPVFSPKIETLGKIMDANISTPSLIGLSINPRYSPQNRELSIQVQGDVHSSNLVAMQQQKPTLSIFITEDHIVGAQAGSKTPNAYEHNAVVRKVLTKTWGDEISWNENGFTSQEYRLSLPPHWKEKALHIIAFVSNYNPTNSNECKVYNSTQANLAQYLSSTKDFISEDHYDNSAVWVEGKTLYCADTIQSLSLFDMSGRAVIIQKAINASQWPLGEIESGYYIALLEVDNKLIACKILLP